MSLADKLLRSPLTSDEHIERARRDLKLSAPNHAPGRSVDQPFAERFVFPSDTDVVLAKVFEHRDSREIAFSIARVPCFPCWLEHGVFGWHCWKSTDGEAYATFFLGRTPVAVLGASFGKSECVEVSITRSGAAYIAEGFFSEAQLIKAAPHIVFLLAALISPRVTSVRCQKPGSTLSAAERAFRRKRAQEGRPVFSFNVVTFEPAKTALHRGELKSIESFAGVRGHVVMGHWRLIGGKIEPYWVWVDGHRRGDDRLGVIVKQRQVQGLSQRFRKGFVVPSDIGALGEKRRAARL